MEKQKIKSVTKEKKENSSTAEKIIEFWEE